MKVIFFALLLHFSHGNVVDKFFNKINHDIIKFNQFATKITWDASVHPNKLGSIDGIGSFLKQHLKWGDDVCNKLSMLNNGHMLNSTQQRHAYLICRGPKYTYEEYIAKTDVSMVLQRIYSEAKVCFPSDPIPLDDPSRVEAAVLMYMTAISNIAEHLASATYKDEITTAVKVDLTNMVDEKKLVCFYGEEDMLKMMKQVKHEKVLKWLWLMWREKISPFMKEPYKRLVAIENEGARRNGYTDIGAAWRSELEIPDLRQLCRLLYNDVKPLYSMLHAVARHHLWATYGDAVNRLGPIPAHLLGDLWSQNWLPLYELMVPRRLDLDQRIKDLNWTVEHMLRRAEDFYQSLGLPPMTRTFWKKSVIKRENNKTQCHGTAADMYQHGDYRLLYCSGTSAEDFYVIHHEMGHIQYYMAYENQPGNFRQANSAFQETIGDSIMLGVLTPQHLHRLGLITDPEVFEQRDQRNDQNEVNIDDDDDFDDDINVEGKARPAKLNVGKITADEVLLLQTALTKLPQIPFALLVDEYRWKYFEGSLDENTLNQEFWRMTEELQGIAPPDVRDERYFDVTAKYHVPDGTPYIRYFLSSFLQHQVFEALCKAAVFGRRGVTEDLPSSIAVHRCDIYGSKPAGKLLKDFMSRGNSQHWRQILKSTTGFSSISAGALKRYYRPLYRLLKKIIRANNIPIGW